MSIAPNRRPSAWRTTILSLAALAVVGTSALALPRVVRADTPSTVKEQFADIDPAIAELRAEAGKDRRDVVQANMLLTESEAKRFWPIYDQYRAERVKLGDRKVQLIKDFIANKDAMSEDQAAKLNKEYFAIEKKKIDIKERYVPRFQKVLSARTTARFFQIDQKLDAIVDMTLAAQVPLIH